MSETPQPGAFAGYWHRQIGFFPVLSLFIAAYLLYIGPTDAFRSTAILAYSVIAVFMAALRGALAVKVGDEFIEWWLGLGVLESRVSLEAVAQVEYVPVRFAARGAPEGYYYGASMQSVVALSLTDGSRALLRSSEPARLVEAIERRMGTVPRHRGRRASTTRSKALEVRFSGRRLIALLLIAGAPIMAHELLSPWVRIKGCLSVGTRWHLTYVCPKEVTQVELLDDLPPIERRLESYAVGWNPPGRYLVAGLGDVDLYLAHPWPPYVLVRSEKHTLILNNRWPGRTQRLFERLITWPEASP